MSLSGIKPVTSISGSVSFCRKIIQKHQTGRKNTFRFPTLVFFKKRGYFSPSKISRILNFRLYLDQQNIAPVLILRNIPLTGRRISGLGSEKKSLQSIFKLKNVRSTDDVPKIFPASSRITQEHNVISEHNVTLKHNITSEHFLTENISANKTTVFSLLRSLIFRAGNVANNQNRAINSLFSPASSNFHQQESFTISPNIFTQNSKILNYENNMEILNSHSGKKIWYRWLNTVISPTLVNNKNILKSLTVFENGPSLNYSGKQSTIPSFILSLAVKNTSVIKETFSWLKTEKHGMKSLVEPEDASNTSDAANVSLTALRIPELYQAASGILSTGKIFANKTPIFSFLKYFIFKAGKIATKSNKILKSSFFPAIDNEYMLNHWSLFGDKLPLNQSGNKNIIPSFTPSLVVKNIPAAGGRITGLNAENELFQSIFQIKNVQKTPFFLFLKFLTLKAGNVTNDSNKTLKSFFSSLSSNFYQQKILAISPYILTLNSKTLSYEKNIEIFNSQIAEKKICYKLLNITENSTFIGKENTLMSLPVSENKLPLNQPGNKNTMSSLIPSSIPSLTLYLIPSLVVKNIHVIKDILSRLKTEKNCLKSIARQKDAMNVNYTSNVYVSQETFKTQQGFYEGSDFLLTENAFSDRFLTEKTGSVSELLLNSKKLSVLTVIDRYFERFRPFERFHPFRFSTFHTLHDPFLKYLVFKAGNKIIGSNRIPKPQLWSEYSIYYQQAANSIYSGAAEVSYQVLVSSHILNSKINEKILNSQVFRANKNYGSLNITSHSSFFNKKNVLKSQPFFKGKLPAVLLQDNSLFNKKPGVNRRFFKESNRAASNGPFIKYYYSSSGHGTSGYVQSNHNYKMRPDSLVFQDQGHIEQEIEQIKRTIIETKKSVSEKTVPVFGEAEIKKYLDINRISSQVYQNIERTIRMERERRGV